MTKAIEKDLKDLKDKKEEMKLKEQKALEFYQFLKDRNCILFETVVGSQAYGTQVSTSDIDYKFVYILPQDYIMGTGYIEQLNVTKDITGWEVRRFLELLSSNNPTCLELLASPEDCITKKHPLFDLILERKDEFVTKSCKNSFGGYAIAQIKKASGLNKKQNWEKDKIIRKDLLDFCYVIQDEKTIPWKKWNGAGEREYEERFIGAVNVPNAKDVYALYYDIKSRNCFSESIPKEQREILKKLLKGKNENVGLGYKGLVKVGESNNLGLSNQLRLSSIPKDEKVICNIIYNKDGYSSHCKDYKEYQEWLKNRNTHRWVETKEIGQKIDSKNLMHCIRLIRMAQEIGRGEGINVRRKDREELLGIRRGELTLII